MQTGRSTFLFGLFPTLALTFFLVPFALPSPAFGAWPTPLKVARSRGLVVADTAQASQAGAEVLARGGNAADAAVATALALGVVAPGGSGLGGGGFLIYWSAKLHRAFALDFRETAPRGASRDMYLVAGKAAPEKSRHGGLAVAVPGEPAGLAELEAKYGKLGLKAVTAPAIRLARQGFSVSARTARYAGQVLSEVPAGDPLAARLRAFAPGPTFKNEPLAKTLERFAAEGAAPFYKGEIAREIVEVDRKNGGVLTMEDLAAYKPEWREPISGHFRSRTIWAVPPPAGGATLIQILQILDARPPLKQPGSSEALHPIAEALKHAFADRAHFMGDPAFVDVPWKKLIDPAYARELAARIGEKTLPSDQYGMAGAKKEPRDHGTSHLCVADGEGNVASLTTTINLPFGARLSAAGMVLNDEMDDFVAQPGVPNAFGLVGGEANAIAPGKRPLSSMTPTVLTDESGALLCAGGSGGPLIVSETAQTVINVVDFAMNAEAAVSAPRIHAQWVPDILFAESDIPADVRQNLEKHGHKVMLPPGDGAAQVIILGADGLEGGADPRKGGAPAAP
jgi:gamma-glutamyltranspeptidase/glutathione hydrolase